jgi:hypothetical protein
MNVYADFHHSGLFYSFHLLFEKRLGWNLYSPIGTEWFKEGYWAIARPYDDNPDTVKQFLSLNTVPKDGTQPLNTVMGIAPTHYQIHDIAHGYTRKAITLNQFKEMNIDLIIASIPDHWKIYTEMRDTYHPNAKVICHMGNMFVEVRRMIQEGIVDNLMAATIPFQFSRNINSVFYHEEQPIRGYMDPGALNKINSFVNVLPNVSMYDSYKKELKEFEMKAYGGGSPDGVIDTLSEIYNKIQESKFIYHVKPGGDGYGWIWHSAFMLGRPIITQFHDYQNKLGGLLFQDGITGIDLDKGTVQENCERIRKIANDPLYYEHMSLEAHNRFFSIIDYEREEKELRLFLERCI